MAATVGLVVAAAARCVKDVVGDAVAVVGRTAAAVVAFVAVGSQTVARASFGEVRQGQGEAGRK